MFRDSSIHTHIFNELDDGLHVGCSCGLKTLMQIYGPPCHIDENDLETIISLEVDIRELRKGNPPNAQI